MRNPFTFFCIVLVTLTQFLYSPTVNAQSADTGEKQRWAKHAQQTNIIRDEWGIPHIYGKTDADAVFGLMLSLIHI